MESQTLVVFGAIVVVLLGLVGCYSSSRSDGTGSLRMKGTANLAFVQTTDPGLSFEWSTNNGSYTSEVVRINPSNDYAVSENQDGFEMEPDSVEVHRVTNSGEAALNFCNVEGPDGVKRTFIWSGPFKGLRDASSLDLNGQIVIQAAQIASDTFIVATEKYLGNWKQSIFVLNREGRILNTLYSGSDLAHRDRAYEGRVYLDDGVSDVSVSRMAPNEYFIPFQLGNESSMVVYGTDVANYDSFFSAQGYRLARSSKIYTFTPENPNGKHIGKFKLNHGLPFATIRTEEDLYLKSLDTRDREKIEVHYYQIKPNRT